MSKKKIIVEMEYREFVRENRFNENRSIFISKVSDILRNKNESTDFVIVSQVTKLLKEYEHNNNMIY